jgi:VCBS repeat-containing protein
VGKKKNVIGRFKRPKTDKLGLERLEDRLLLASNVLASVEGALGPGGGDATPSEPTEAVFELSIDSESPRVTLGLMVTPTGQANNLDPAAPRVLHNGVQVSPFYSTSDVRRGRHPGVTLTELASGETYSVVVGHESPGSGDFRLDAFLPGDLSGDGRVDQLEFLRVSAAVVQNHFGGNHVSRLFFRQRGLNVSTNLYRDDLDANFNGVIDAFDLESVKRNVGLRPVSVELLGDESAPEIQAAVSPDTGRFNDDGITNDTNSTVSGTIRDRSRIVRFQAAIDDSSPDSFVDLLGPGFFQGQDFSTNPSFVLTLSQLEEIAGTGADSLVDSGTHTLFLDAADELGNALSAPISVLFEFDTIAPPAPDEPTLVGGGADVITDNTPTFSVDATPDVLVTLLSNLVAGPIGEAVAVDGSVTITTIELPDGAHQFTAMATDVAGNQSDVDFSGTPEIVIDTGDPELTRFTVSPPTTQTDQTGNPLTAESVVTIVGTTEAGSTVELEQDGQPSKTTVADDQGAFSFAGVMLPFGQTGFVVTITDVAGNAPQFKRTLTRDAAPELLVRAGDQRLDEDDPPITIDLATIFNDPDLVENDRLTFTAVNTNPNVLGHSIAGETITLTPQPEQSGMAEITVRATDLFGLSVEGTLKVTVNLVNDAPVITAPAAVTVATNTEQRIPGISVSDVDLDESGIIVSLRAGLRDDPPEDLLGLMSVTPVGNVSILFGTATNSDRISLQGNLDDINDTLATLRYQPEPGFEGSAVLSVIANDFGITGPDDQQEAEHVINITVVMDEPPEAIEDEFDSGEDRIVMGNVLADNGNGPDFDPDGDDSLLNVTNAGTLSSALGASVTLQANGNFTYDPTGAENVQAIAAGEVRIDLFEYLLTDGVTTSTGTVIIRLTGTNDLPVARDDRLATNSFRTLSANVLDNNGNGPDSDVDDTLVVTRTGSFFSNLGARVTLNAQGDLTYDPTVSDALQDLDEGQQQTDSFSYTISDGTATATATVTVTVTGGAQAPPVAMGDTAQVDGASRDNRIDVLGNDSTGDAGEVLSLVSVGSTTDGGSVRIAPDGRAVLYTPAAGFLGTERFQYVISDGRGGTDEAVATMQVTPGEAPLDEHIHASMSIYYNGQRVPNPPANIGVRTDRIVSVVHTHEADGRIHIHPVNQVPRREPTTLGDFFDTWRTNAQQAGNNPNAIFNENQILQYAVDANHVIRMFVNGVPNFEFENYIPENEDQIVISYEPLTEPGTPTIVPIADVTIQAGAPLHIPLDGFDFEGDPLTFTATSSNPNRVSTFIPEGDRSMRINVEDFGVMTFQLFDGRVPRVTDAIAGLAEEGVYDGVIFHRIIEQFVIQGGDPTGTGFGDPTLPDFDDQFHVDLQHTSAGVLSMAKAGDDTNSSQFFITAAPTRFLDFNHSVFGQLIEGENVRRNIALVETGANDRPVNDVVMRDVQILVDRENAVLMLKAPEGASGQVDVTVTVREPSGRTHARTFRVTVAPDTFNGGPFLEDIPEIRTTVNTPVQFELRAIDVEGDAVVFDASRTSTTPFNFTLDDDTDDPHTALIRVTPPIDFIGTLELTVMVKPETRSNTGGGLDPDTQLVRIVVNAPASALAAQLAALGSHDESALVDEAITNWEAASHLRFI